MLISFLDRNVPWFAQHHTLGSFLIALALLGLVAAATLWSPDWRALERKFITGVSELLIIAGITAGFYWGLGRHGWSAYWHIGACVASVFLGLGVLMNRYMGFVIALRKTRQPTAAVEILQQPSPATNQAG